MKAEWGRSITDAFVRGMNGGAVVDDPPRRPPAYSIEASETHVIPDPTEAIRAGVSEPPFWAVIHPSGFVSFVHGRPTTRDLQRAVSGFLMLIDQPDVTITAYVNQDQRDLGANLPAAKFLRLTYALFGPVVIIGAPDPAGDDTPLPGDARLRLAHEVIEA